MGKLGNLKEIPGQPVHQFSGTVHIIKLKVQILQMAKQRFPDVSLHPHTKGMPPVGHNIITH